MKALKTTSVTRWLVRTFPPTTAASAAGLSREPSGMWTVMGFMQPCPATESMRRHTGSQQSAGVHRWQLNRRAAAQEPHACAPVWLNPMEAVQESHLVQRDLLADHAAQRVDDGAVGHGGRRVGVAKHLRPSAREIKGRAPITSVHSDGQLDGGACTCGRPRLSVPVPSRCSAELSTSRTIIHLIFCVYCALARQPLSL